MATLAALVLLSQSAGFTFRKRADPPGGWDLMLEGRKVEAVDSAQAVIVDLFRTNWREPAMDARKQPASATSKQLYVAFLKRRYGYQIGAVNQAYGLEASAFTELESEDFSKVPLDRMETDDLEFVAGWVEDRLAGRDPKRLILVALGPEPLPARLVEAASKAASGFVLRDPAGPRSPIPHPVLTGCASTVRPAWIAACVRISNP